MVTCTSCVLRTPTFSTQLLKLGIAVAKRTIQRYLRAVRLPAPPRGQSWKTAWPTTPFGLDAVVINLGTNDFLDRAHRRRDLR